MRAARGAAAGAGPPCRVAVIEDHRLQRQGVVELLDAQPGIRVVWNGESLPGFVAWLGRLPTGRRPHLLVLDLHVDGERSADPAVVGTLVRTGMRVMLLSTLQPRGLVRAMLAAGATGAVGKRDADEDIVGAVRAVLDGRTWFSPELTAVRPRRRRPRLSGQEERALALYASGHTLQAVADRLGVRVGTAKKYIGRAKAKYAAVDRPARTKVDLNRVARQDGLVPDRGDDPG